MSSNVSLYGIGASSVSLASLGIEPIVQTRSPTTSDVQGPGGPYNLGQVWINKLANLAFILTSLTSIGGLSQATWVQTGSTGALSTITGNSGGPISPSAGNIGIVGSGTLTVTGSGNTLTISQTGASSFMWNTVAGPQTMVTNMGYITTGGTNFTLTMPTSSSQGDQVGVIVNGTGTITIARGTQTIRILSQVGGGTGFASAGQGYAVIFVCTTASSAWVATSNEGTWTQV